MAVSEMCSGLLNNVNLRYAVLSSGNLISEHEQTYAERPLPCCIAFQVSVSEAPISNLQHLALLVSVRGRGRR